MAATSRDFTGGSPVGGFPPSLSSVCVELGDRKFEPFDPAGKAFLSRVAFDEGRLSDLLALLEGQPGSVLDLGAAPYILTAGLLQEGWTVTANGLPITGYETRGTLTIGYSDDSSLAAHVSLFDVEEPFPLDSESFDAVIAGEIFEHLYRQPWVLFREAWRCLRPGGLLYLTTPNGLCVDRLIQLVKREAAGMGFNPDAPTIRHAREYSPEEIREVAVSQGFMVERIFTRNYSHISEDGFRGFLGPAKRSAYNALLRLSEQKRGFLRDRGQITLMVAKRGDELPSDPPGFMVYGIGDERTGYNFAAPSSP